MKPHHLLPLAVVACGGDDPPKPDQETGIPSAVSLSCAAEPGQPNRASCRVDDEGPVELRVTLYGAERSFFGEGGAPVALWGLGPDTDLEITEVNRGVSTMLRTGTWTGARLELETAPDPSLPIVVLDWDCDGGPALWGFDGEGTPRLREDFLAEAPERPALQAFEPTEDGTLLALLGRSRIAEKSWSGELIWLADRTAGDFDTPLHHEVTRRNGRTWALTARLGEVPGLGAVVWDGFLVFGRDRRVEASWFAEGHLDPFRGNPCCSDFWGTEWPGALDFAHSNALGVGADGIGWLSYRYVSAIQQVVVDPDRPDFGQVRATLVGDPASPALGTVRIGIPPGSPAAFASQHDTHADPDGTLALFDNQWRGESRALRFSIDEEAWRADPAEVLRLGESCRIMGSNRRLADGRRLILCSPERRLMVFDPSVPAITWSARLTCDSARDLRPPYRALPADPWTIAR